MSEKARGMILMAAGPKLDSRVAEWVFDRQVMDRVDLTSGRQWWEFNATPDAPVPTYLPVPAYTTDAEAFGDVARWLEARGWRYRVAKVGPLGPPDFPRIEGVVLTAENPVDGERQWAGSTEYGAACTFAIDVALEERQRQGRRPSWVARRRGESSA